MSAGANGQLRFCADFEGGSIGSVTPGENGAEYDINVREDATGPQHRWWFHFQMHGGMQGQKAMLNLVICSKARELYRHGVAPVMRSSSQPLWARLPPSTCTYHEKPPNSHVVSVAFTIERANEVYEFAYTFPYSYSQLQQWLLKLEGGQQELCLQRHLLCQSPQQRRVDVLTIENSGPVAGQARPVVVVIARVHPGETPASFVAQGLTEWLLCPAKQAVQLREAATIIVIPMLNPDGVCLGNYRSDAGGQDLNRLWGSTTEEGQPAIHHTLQLLHRYNDDPLYRLELFVDIHSHSASPAGFLFCNSPADSSQAGMARVNRLPNLLEGKMPGFSQSATRYEEDVRKAGCARSVVGAIFKQALSYTLEVSMNNIPAYNAQHLSPSDELHADCQGKHERKEAADPATDFCNTPEGYIAMGKQLGTAFAVMFGEVTCASEKSC